MLSYNRILLLCLTLVGSVWAKPSLYYSVDAELIYDTNIPQNITEYPAWYGSPSLYVKLRPGGSGSAFSIWSRFQYENHLRMRSATLSPPVTRSGVSLDMEFSKLALALDYGFDSYHYHTWQLARVNHGIDTRLALELGNSTLGLSGDFAWEDYGDDAYDGLESRIALDLGHEPDIRKSQPLGMSEIFVRTDLATAFNRSDTTSYLAAGLDIGTEIKLWAAELDASVGIARRQYRALREHPHTGELLHPTNRYLNTGLGISLPAGPFLSIGVDGKLRFKASNYPQYAYDRHTLSVSLKWRDLVK